MTLIGKLHLLAAERSAGAGGKMAELFWIALPEDQARCWGHIVFVHGLGGHPVETFKAESGTFWPEMLAGEMPDIGIWTLSYSAPPSNWTGHGLDIERRALTVLRRLQVTPELGKQPVVFICHSLGGLVIKQMLRYLNENKEQEEMAELLARVRGLVFLATPHGGAMLGNWASWLSAIVNPADAVLEMTFGNTKLKSLNDWFRNWSKRPETLVFYETISIGVGRVVDTLGGDAHLPGVIAQPVEADHFNICKPESFRDLTHRQIGKFLREKIGWHHHPGSGYRNTLRTEPIVVPRQKIPLFPRFVRASAILGAILFVGVGLYYLVRPPSPPREPGRLPESFTPATILARPNPDTVVIRVGGYRAVAYSFRETTGMAVTLDSQDVRWLLSNGTVIRSEANNRILGGSIAIGGNSTFEFVDNVYLPADIGAILRAGQSYVQLETIFRGVDGVGRTTAIKTILRIHAES